MPQLRVPTAPTTVQRGCSASVEAKLSPTSDRTDASDVSSASDASDSSDEVSDEARDLKALLLRRHSRLLCFSPRRMHRVVVPPADISHPLDVAGGLMYLVLSVEIPMTIDMEHRHRKKLLRRLPDVINE